MLSSLSLHHHHHHHHHHYYDHLLLLLVLLLGLLSTQTSGQLTLTGCHIHEGQEVCLLPGGAETIIAAAVSPSPTAPAGNAASATPAAQTTAITDCHNHGTTQVCVKGNGEEVQVLATATSGGALPTAYTGCHAHGTELFCETPDGGEVEAVAMGAETGDNHEGEEHGDEEAAGEKCHFHAGVEHCTGGSEASGEPVCERVNRDYNRPLRVGLLFVILTTSAFAVYAPILLRKLLHVNPTGAVFTVVKQFGTGIIIATALIHLLTHAVLMFNNRCLGELQYESTATAIAMAGAFLAFLVDFTGHRLALWRRNKVPEASSNESSDESRPREIAKGQSLRTDNTTLAHLSHHHLSGPASPNDYLGVLILEAGIIFHSLLLGLTLVVASDSVFITLFIVIVFHQMFEGLALGARIAAIDDSLRTTKYLTLPLAFALVTPTGMAIGIAVLGQFNGNDPKTIVAIGTLDALSAGILLWVGFVSMWARDWMGGELRDAGLLKTGLAGVSLLAGMVGMGVLGKWA